MFVERDHFETEGMLAESQYELQNLLKSRNEENRTEEYEKSQENEPREASLLLQCRLQSI